MEINIDHVLIPGTDRTELRDAIVQLDQERKNLRKELFDTNYKLKLLEMRCEKEEAYVRKVR